MIMIILTTILILAIIQSLKGSHFDKENNNKMNNDNGEYLISFLYTEIDKLKTNSKVKAKEIIRLNKIISVLEIDICKLQEQQKYNKHINDNHNQANSNQMYEDIKEAFNKELNEYKEEISELKHQHKNKIMDEKLKIKTMTKALKAVLFEAKQLKMNCNIMKQELQYMHETNKEICLQIMNKLNSNLNINNLIINPKPDFYLNVQAPVKTISHKWQWKINEFFHIENAKLENRFFEAEQENKALIQELKDINYENHSLKSIIQGYLTKNGLNSINTQKLKEYYERILKEKDMEIKGVHNAINESINCIHDISSINKANALDKEVKTIMGKTY